jgi:hypothetical protein
MSKFKIAGMMALIAFAMGIVLMGDALAQQKTLKEQLVGTWTLVSNDVVAPDGTRRPNFGPNPKGILIIDANGRYAQIQLNPNRPKFKGKTRLEGTSEENKAVVQATSASFGMWSVNEADKSAIQNVEFHIFPNDDGRNVKFSITLTGDELKYTNPSASAGGIVEAVYKRAK